MKFATPPPAQKNPKIEPPIGNGMIAISSEQPVSGSKEILFCNVQVTRVINPVRNTY